MQTLSSWPWRALKTAGTWLVALVILFEEWGWAPLARWMGRLSRLPVVAWIERGVVRLSPRLALVAFFIPALLLLPVKIGALWLIGRGQLVTGVLVLLVAKVLGTAVVARIFLLTQPQLMRLPWFARGYGRWLAWKARVLARARASASWRLTRRAARRLRASLRRRTRRVRRT